MQDHDDRRGATRLPMGEPTNVNDVVERNIRALLLRRRAAEALKSRDERIADTVTRFAGSMRLVYFHLVVFGGWIAINGGWIPFIEPFDPTFVILAMVASVEAIFLSTFVLISQNRMASQEAQRADLDLQVSLLAEHEITRLITLVTAIAAKMDIAESRHPELVELAKDIVPESVLQTMEETAAKLSDELKG